MTDISRRSVLTALGGLSATAMLGSAGAGAESEMKSVEIKKVPKYRGVVYDVGLNFAVVHDMGLNGPGGLSTPGFDTALVEYDMRVIRNDLHANAVRIEGGVIERLVFAARVAHKLGLAVFFNPWKMGVGPDELRPYYAAAAREAEVLRKEGVDIVFIAGCEYPIFQSGILAGETVTERVFRRPIEQLIADLRAKRPQLNEYLRSFVDVIRREFAGPVTYAATTLEDIDWSMFDIVGVDHYRGGESAEQYVEKLNNYKEHKKPVVVMEFGCCTYAGAAKLGGGGYMVLEGSNPDGSGRFKNGVVPTRSEEEQADYVETQTKLIVNSGVEGLFVYVYALPLYSHGEGAKDLDLVSYSLVKTFPKDNPRSKQMPPWAPKQSFHRVAELYARMQQLRS